jgi:hypothetical protein
MKAASRFTLTAEAIHIRHGTEPPIRILEGCQTLAGGFGRRADTTGQRCKEVVRTPGGVPDLRPLQGSMRFAPFETGGVGLWPQPPATVWEPCRVPRRPARTVLAGGAKIRAHPRNPRQKLPAYFRVAEPARPAEVTSSSFAPWPAAPDDFGLCDVLAR